MRHPEDESFDVAKTRRDRDAAQYARRSNADGDRAEQRKLGDGARQNARGDRQSHERLDRERARDDADRHDERSDADRTRNAEREVGDAALAREKQAHADATDALGRRLDRDARRDKALAESLALVKGQIEIAATGIAAILAEVPRGTFDGRLSESVEQIRSASARMKTLLEDALDPDDRRRRDHEVGGEG